MTTPIVLGLISSAHGVNCGDSWERKNMLHSFYCTSSVRLIKNSFHVGSAPSRLTLMPLLSPPRTSRLQTTTAVTASTELLLVAMEATASARFCDVRPPFRRMEHAAVKCTSFYSFSSKGRTRAFFFGTSAGRLITHVSAVKNNLIRQALNRMELNTTRQDWCSRDRGGLTDFALRLRSVAKLALTTAVSCLESPSAAFKTFYTVRAIPLHTTC